MPMTHCQAPALETPKVRLKIQLPDGQVHTVTLSSTFDMPKNESKSEAYKDDLLRAFRSFYEPRGVTILRMEWISSVSMEIGL
jgi:hypothetical protein